MLLTTNGIQGILFDLDGTLRYSVPSPNHTFLNFAAEAGVPDSPEKRRATLRWVHYYWAQSPEFLEDVAVYEELNNAFWVFYAYRTLCAFGCEDEQARALAGVVQQRMEDEYHAEDHLGPDVLTTLEALQAAGFAMGIASNRGKPYDEQVAALGLGPYVAFALAAGQVRSWKPEPGLFLHAADLLGVSPQNTLYVGDNYYADIIGARRAGLTPVLIDPEGLFPEADCTVIRSIGELLPLLGK